MLMDKVAVRAAVRAAAIPHTFICAYWPHGFLLPRLGDPQLVVDDAIATPPTTKATIFGNDNTRVIFVHEADMSALTIRAVEDPRTLNKILYVRPAPNTCSFSHLVGLWEHKTGRTLHRYYMPDDELVARINRPPPPLNLQLAMVHATVAAGICDKTVDAAAGVEATDLYPDVNYITVRPRLPPSSDDDASHDDLTVVSFASSK